MREHPSVLIVHADREFAEQLASVLRSANLESAPDITICSSKVIDEGVRGQHFDVALCELAGPGDSGFAWLEQLQNRSPFLQVVVITDDSRVHRALAAWDAGAFGYLPRPLDPERLLEIVGRAFTHVQRLEERDVLERRARQAERLAAAGTLAAGLAHELRNPLNSATLQLQLLRRRLKRETLDMAGMLQTVGAVEAEIGRLSRLVDDFVAFAKPQPLELAPVDPAQLVARVLAELEPGARAARVSLAANVRPTGLVPLDEARMRRVLTQLVTNSLEAIGKAEDRHVLVRVHAERRSARVLIDVEDDGPGFEPNAPIFDAFYTSKNSGTGLGLAFVHRVVTEHGGTIHAHSSPGRTVFQIALPQKVPRETA